MKNTILKTIFALMMTSLLIVGCKKDEIRPAPNIAFITGGTYISGDATVLSGDTILVGIQCTWNGTDVIKTMTFYDNDVMVETPVDIPEAYGQGFIYNIKITKSDALTEKWVFEATDTQGEKSSVGFTLTVKNTGGAITEFTATIGAQDNVTEYGYYSLSSHLNYNATNARTNYAIIDLLGAYDAINAVYLASPSAPGLPEPYPTDMADWTGTNNTLFCITTLSTVQFDYINRDNLLISSFSTNVANQKNKAKSLAVNNVYSFKTQAGKYGLFKVTAVTAGSTGKVTVDIKIQP